MMMDPMPAGKFCFSVFPSHFLSFFLPQSLYRDIPSALTLSIDPTDLRMKDSAKRIVLHICIWLYFFFSSEIFYTKEIKRKYIYTKLIETGTRSHINTYRCYIIVVNPTSWHNSIFFFFLIYTCSDRNSESLQPSAHFRKVFLVNDSYK